MGGGTPRPRGRATWTSLRCLEHSLSLVPAQSPLHRLHPHVSLAENIKPQQPFIPLPLRALDPQVLWATAQWRFSRP